MEALSLIGDLGLNVVDEKEIARCREMFTLYDEDKDGKLTYAELLTCVRCCGRNPSVDEFKEMVQVIDTKLVRSLAPIPSLLPSPIPTPSAIPCLNHASLSLATRTVGSGAQHSARALRRRELRVPCHALARVGLLRGGAVCREGGCRVVVRFGFVLSRKAEILRD